MSNRPSHLAMSISEYTLKSGDVVFASGVGHKSGSLQFSSGDAELGTSGQITLAAGASTNSENTGFVKLSSGT